MTIATVKVKDYRISIHTLRMEGDVLAGVDRQWYNISIHTLRMEGDGKRGRNGYD